jgi:hypothetical protein
MEALIDIALKLGLPAAIAVYLIWRTDQRDQGTIGRLQATEDWIRTTLVALNATTAESVRDNTLALRESARMHRQILEALDERP